MMNGIRQKWGELKLSQRSRHLSATREIIGFDQADYFGILFNASELRNEEIIKKLVKHLVKNQKKVKAVGFIDLKERLSIPMSTLRFDYFSSKELDFTFIPNSNPAIHFLEERFDILLDFNLNDDFPVRYLSRLSRARCKVGMKSESDHFDVSMMIEEGNMVQMVEESMRYLQMFKK